MANPEDGDVAGGTAAIRGADGEDTSEFPFAVFVVTGRTCTGTLISPSHVLTAAHCVDTSFPRSVVLAPRSEDANPAIEIAAAGCFMYPRYTQANSVFLREEWATATEAGDRCAVLDDASSTPNADFAIIVLERVSVLPVCAGGA